MIIMKNQRTKRKSAKANPTIGTENVGRSILIWVEPENLKVGNL